MDPMMKQEREMMSQQLRQGQAQVEEAEDSQYEMVAPKGNFSAKGLNALVDASNKLAPLFGLDSYPRFTEDQVSLPPEFMRLLSMFMAAIEDAIEEGVLPEEAMLAFEGITDDRGLQQLAARLLMASKVPTFKRFLSKKEKPESETKIEIEIGGEGEEPESADKMSEDQIMKLMKSRM